MTMVDTGNDAAGSSQNPQNAAGTPAPQAAPFPVQPVSPQPAAEAAAPPQTPTLHSSAPYVPPPSSGNPLQDDISKILSSVKIPERKAPEKAPQRVYDTSIPDVQPVLTTPTRFAPSEASSPQAAAIEKSAVEMGHTEGDVRAVHTLKDDLQSVVKENKMSLVRAAALEEEKRHKIEQNPVVTRPARPRGIGLAIFVSLLLFGLGGLALGAVYVVMQERATSSPTAGTDSLLFAEQTIPLPTDGLVTNDIRRTIAAARQSAALTLGAILEIVPTVNVADAAANQNITTKLTFSQFMTAIGAKPPEELLRATGDEFFLGIHTVDENAPVIVVTVESYERAFAGMLRWEPDMNADLSPMFTAVPRQATGPDGLPVERAFEDAVMRNYDVRTLKDDAGTVQLYYSFPTRNILIIAESPYSFAEILSRLRADRRL